MAISNYPNGFPSGVVIQNLPLTLLHPGKVFWLNNSSVLAPNGGGGSDSNDGSYRRPFASLAGALANTNVVDSRGDIIVCMPGHAETISSATALTLSKAGIVVVGLGRGSLRPTFTLDTAATATINVTAANCCFVNCLFVANYAAIASCFTTTTAKNFSLQSCEFRDTSSILNFDALVDTDTTSNHTDGLSIIDCQWFGLGADANTCVVKMDGTNTRLTVKDSYFTHAATTAAGFMPIATGKVVTNLMCVNNVFNLVGATNLTTGTLITTDGSTNSGILSKNLIQELDATSEILVTAASGFIFSQNYSSAVADKSGYLLPAADS